MASRMRYVVAAVMLIGLASSLAIAAGVSEVSFWGCTAPKGADYREYCFNSTLPAFEGAYIRVPSLFKKRDEGRYTMRTQISNPPKDLTSQAANPDTLKASSSEREDKQLRHTSFNSSNPS